MTFVLCEECFPDADEHEVLTIVPMSPCKACGRFDQSHTKGLRANLFRRDPRDAEQRRPQATSQEQGA